MYSYLHILNKDSSGLPIGALGALPTSGTPYAANASLAAHTIPISCCLGKEEIFQQGW